MWIAPGSHKKTPQAVLEMRRTPPSMLFRISCPWVLLYKEGRSSHGIASTKHARKNTGSKGWGADFDAKVPASRPPWQSAWGTPGEPTTGSNLWEQQISRQSKNQSEAKAARTTHTTSLTEMATCTLATPDGTLEISIAPPHPFPIPFLDHCKDNLNANPSVGRECSWKWRWEWLLTL